MKPVVLVLGGVVLAGVCVLGWRQGGAPDETRSASVSSPSSASPKDFSAENDRLRRENAALRRQLSEASKTGGTSVASLPSVPVPEAAAPAVPVEELLARAKASLKSKDSVLFSEAFLALLDAGEPGYAAVLGLVGEGGIQKLFQQLDPEVYQQMYREFILRSPRLGGLLDAALRRGGDSRGALGFAAYLYQQGVASTLPREEQVGTLLAFLKKEAASGESNDGILQSLAQVLLAKLKAVEALPDIEKLYAGIPERSRWSLTWALGSMNRPEAVDLIRRLLGTTIDAQSRGQFINALYQSRSKEANDLLWELEAKGEVRNVRMQILQMLAMRPENLDRMLSRIVDPALPEEDRQGMLWGLMAAARSRDEAREAVWRLYESQPAQQDLILQTALQYGDAKAQGLLVERLRSGRITETLAQTLPQLDPRVLRDNLESLRPLVASGSSLQIRSHAYQAMSRVDAPGAVQALLTGFDRLPEDRRVQVTNSLAWPQTAEGKAALQGIAANDPSEEVRQAAANALKN